MESIESQFLKEFTRRLIINSSPQKVRERIISQIKTTPKKEEIKQIQKEASKETKIPLYQKQDTQKPIPSQRITISAMKKINPLIADPSVLSIECPGPNKPLLINQRGFVKTANIMLNKNEIDSIIEEYSEKTKIPLIEGIFKAYYKNLIITAVVSEYVGTRFIVQKRMPS